MSSLRTACRPHAMISSFLCSSRWPVMPMVSFRNPNNKRCFSVFSPSFNSSSGFCRTEKWLRINQRRTLAMASNWANEKSPYETLGNFLFLSLFLSFLTRSVFYSSYGCSKLSFSTALDMFILH